MSHPGGSAADLQQAQPEQGDWRYCVPRWSCLTGESWPKPFRVMEVTDLTASAFGFPCTSLPSPSANARLPDSTFNQQSTSTARDRNQHGWLTNSPQFTVKLELLPIRAFGLGYPAHWKGGSQGNACTLGSSGQLQLRCRDPDSVPLEEEGVTITTLGKHLSDVIWSTWPNHLTTGLIHKENYNSMYSKKSPQYCKVIIL